MITIPIPIFIKNIFERSERDKEIDGHIEIVNIKLGIQQEAELLFNRAYNQLTERRKKVIMKIKPIIIFPTRGDYLDWLRMEMKNRYGIKYEDYSFVRNLKNEKK